MSEHKRPPPYEVGCDAAAGGPGVPGEIVRRTVELFFCVRGYADPRPQAAGSSQQTPDSKSGVHGDLGLVIESARWLRKTLRKVDLVSLASAYPGRDTNFTYDQEEVLASWIQATVMEASIGTGTTASGVNYPLLGDDDWQVLIAAIERALEEEQT